MQVKNFRGIFCIVYMCWFTNHFLAFTWYLTIFRQLWNEIKFFSFIHYDIRSSILQVKYFWGFFVLFVSVSWFFGYFGHFCNIRSYSGVAKRIKFCCSICHDILRSLVQVNVFSSICIIYMCFSILGDTEAYT